MTGVRRSTRHARTRWAAAGAALAVAGAMVVMAQPVVAAETGTIAVCVTDSTGANVTLGGDQAWWQQGSSHYLGAVGDSGCRESSVPAGPVTVWAGVSGTFSSHRTVEVTAGESTTVNFYTTKVTIQYPGSVAFGGAGNSAWFKGTTATASMELLSNGTDPTMFRMSTPAGFVRTPVSWPEATTTGKKANFTLIAMQVKNNDGTPQAGATARSDETYGYFALGQTDANGLLGWAHPGVTAGNVTVRAKVNNTTQEQALTADAAKLFTFQTTKVTLHYSQDVRYFYSDTYASWFDKPSMELFEGTYPLQLQTVSATGDPGTQYAQTNLVVPAPADGPIEKSAVVFRLNDSTGVGLVGTPSYYLGGWHAAPATTMGAAYFAIPANTGTDAGVSAILLDGAPKNVSAAMTYNGTRQQLPAQNIQTNSVFYFHTSNVTVNLKDSNNKPLDTGTASYYAGGWHTIGNTESGAVSVEMLPGSYSFAMVYNGTRQQLNGQQISGNASTVEFKTTLVNVEVQKTLKGDTGILSIPADGSASYYAGSWRDITNQKNPNDPRMVRVQMLPGTYSFAATMNGSRQQKSVTVGASAMTVYFHVAEVSVCPADGASYYAGKWRTIDSSVFLLPGTYAFAAKVNGTRVQQSATIQVPNIYSHENSEQVVTLGGATCGGGTPQVQ